jgi:membrane protease YdiL (CAAX protease family)
MRAYVEAGLLVAVWMVLGFALPLDANGYVLAGIPLTIVFQRFVARRPLRAGWLREAPDARVDWRWAVLAVLLAVCPGYLVARAVIARQLSPGLWGVAVIAGAGAAAYAIRYRRPGLVREIARCLAIAGSIGIFWMLLTGLGMRAKAAHPPPFSVVLAIRLVGLYFPACFAVEEVTFRGVLDTHVAQGDPGRWRSALFVSALWGAWHLPLVHTAGPRIGALPILLIAHMTIGVPLSFAWRRNGNLAVPAFTHAAIDAVRDALLHVV